MEAMVGLSKPTPLRCVTLFVRTLGVVAGVLFLLQSILHFLHASGDGFWEFCHWIGESLLGLIVFVIVVYLELKGNISLVTIPMASHLVNRLLLSVLYFWMGFYSMGGVSGEKWKQLAHANGVIAWCAALANLVIAFTFERDQTSSPDRSQTTSVAVPVPEKVPPSVSAETFGNPYTRDPDLEDNRMENPFGDGDPPTMAPPTSGWNTGGAIGFGVR